MQTGFRSKPNRIPRKLDWARRVPCVPDSTRIELDSAGKPEGAPAGAPAPAAADPAASLTLGTCSSALSCESWCALHDPDSDPFECSPGSAGTVKISVQLASAH